MLLLSSIPVDRLTDIMNHYFLNFGAILMLALIVVIATIIGILDRKFLVYSNIISIVAGMGLLTNFYFFGILADNDAPNYSIWLQRSYVLSGIAFVLFIVQVVFLSFNKKGYKENH